jgi:hypothetical protein
MHLLVLSGVRQKDEGVKRRRAEVKALKLLFMKLSSTATFIHSGPVIICPT